MQLQIFSSSFSGGETISLHGVFCFLLGLSKGQRMFFKQVCWVARLILVLPSTNAASERVFSTMKRVKTYLRSTMGQSRLNHLMIIYMYTDELDKMDLTAAAKEFIGGSEHRLRVFGNF